MKKVVKKAVPKKKALVEKKTGEKYASKAMMAKHEKGESKKMRMMEGEIPMKRKGGKSCSCGKASCMMCGGKHKMRAGGIKKYGDGGKSKEVRTGRTYFKESSNEPLEKKDIKKTYVAKNDGKVVARSVTRYPRKGDMYTNLNTTSMDTTGYAAGDKKTFTVKQTKRSLYGKPSGNSWEIARGRVEGTIKDMKNGTKPSKMKKKAVMRKGGKK